MIMNNDLELKDIYAKIVKAIKEAEEEAVKEGIENNTIVLNSNHAKVEKFYYQIPNINARINEFPPMLLGKNLICVDWLPDEYDFALVKTSIKSSADRIHELEKLIHKYVKCDGQSLRFKGLSYKKNIDDFEKIKELLDD